MKNEENKSKKPLLAEIFQLGGGFGFRIPKRRGTGFLKSCVGWVGLNKQGKQLLDILDTKEYIDIRLGDFCDIDGYLFINVRGEYMHDTKKIQAVEKDLKSVIQEVFPFVDGFISV